MSLWHTIDNQNMREERKDSMDMKRLYLVTGAYGHLGHTIVDELLARGEEVRGLSPAGRQHTGAGPPAALRSVRGTSVIRTAW